MIESQLELLIDYWDATKVELNFAHFVKRQGYQHLYFLPTYPNLMNEWEVRQRQVHRFYLSPQDVRRAYSKHNN